MTERISPTVVYDTALGVSYPAWALVTIDGHSFQASGPADWRQALALASMSGGTVAVPAGSAPGPAWTAAARRLAAMVGCSCCGERTLNPDNPDSLNVALCDDCYEQAGWENAHADYHHIAPDPACPCCQEQNPR